MYILLTRQNRNSLFKGKIFTKFHFSEKWMPLLYIFFQKIKFFIIFYASGNGIPKNNDLKAFKTIIGHPCAKIHHKITIKINRKICANTESKKIFLRESVILHQIAESVLATKISGIITRHNT